MGFASLADALRGNGLKLVLDTVPNHMGIAAGNALWEDVLENGPAALHAHFFDVEWDPVKAELRNKVLLPILGDQYGVVLDRGELQLEYQGGSIALRYFDHLLPLNPRAYQDVLGPGVDQVGAQLGESHPDFVELQSILTGLRNLPSRAETLAPEKVLERSREKEVLKRRLDALVSGSPVVAEHLRSEPRAAQRPCPTTRAASTRWTGCSSATSRTGSRTGGWRARRSTTGASSTSTASPPSASRTATCSRRRTRSPSSSWPGARCTACGSTTPTGCSTRARTSSGFKRGTSSTRPAGSPATRWTTRAGPR